MPTTGEPSHGGDRELNEDGSQVRLPKVISFSSLATCGGEVWIENNGQLYRLRRTNQGKLILTK